MNTTLKSRLMSFALASSVAAAALGVPAAQATNKLVGPVLITQLEGVPGTNGGNNVFIGLAAAWPNIDGCTNATYAIMFDNVTNYNVLVAMLYDAYANGDTVTFDVSGCVNVSGITYPIIQYFILQKS